MRRFDTESIKRLRNALRLSQEKFGQRLGMTRQQVYSLEQNEHLPTVRTLERLMMIFGVEESYFFADDHTYTYDTDNNITV